MMWIAHQLMFQDRPQVGTQTNLLQYFLKVKYYNNNNNFIQHHHHHFFNPLGSSIPFPSFTHYFKSFSISYVHTHTKIYIWSCRIKRTVSNLKSPFNCYRVKILYDYHWKCVVEHIEQWIFFCVCLMDLSEWTWLNNLWHVIILIVFPTETPF